MEALWCSLHCWFIFGWASTGTSIQILKKAQTSEDINEGFIALKESFWCIIYICQTKSTGTGSDFKKMASAVRFFVYPLPWSIVVSWLATQTQWPLWEWSPISWLYSLTRVWPQWIHHTFTSSSPTPHSIWHLFGFMGLKVYCGAAHSGVYIWNRQGYCDFSGMPLLNPVGFC